MSTVQDSSYSLSLSPLVCVVQTGELCGRPSGKYGWVVGLV